MRLQKVRSDKDLKLKRVFKKESLREVIRQLVLTSLINRDSFEQPCYVSDIVKDVKANKFVNTVSPSAINSIVNEELYSLSNLIVFDKDNEKQDSKIKVTILPKFYSVFRNLAITDLAHTRATHFIEHYLTEETHKPLEQTFEI